MRVPCHGREILAYFPPAEQSLRSSRVVALGELDVGLAHLVMSGVGCHTQEGIGVRDNIANLREPRQRSDVYLCNGRQG